MDHKRKYWQGTCYPVQDGLSPVHSTEFRPSIFCLTFEVDFITELFLCAMIVFGNPNKFQRYVDGKEIGE